MEALIIDPEKLSKPQTEKELDKAVARVKRHTATAARHVYAVGAELRRIRDKELWALRIDKKSGKAMYDGFWDFCASEIPIHPSYIRRLMVIHENFTLKEVRRHGVARLSVSMTLPPAKRKRFLKVAAAVPAASSELRQIARAMRDEEPGERTYGAPDNTVLAPLQLGIKVIPMWVRERVPVGAIGKPTRPAQNLTDDPWTKMQLAKDLMLYARMSRNTRGELVMIFEIRQRQERVDEEDQYDEEPVIDD